MLFLSYCYLKLFFYPICFFLFVTVFCHVLFLLLCTLIFLCGELSNPSSFCYGTITVQDDAAPGTQEYIMLRQDSIHSADIRSKGSPFRAKCHEIFCCPLKQVVHKESSEPEGLLPPPFSFWHPQPLSFLFLLLFFVWTDIILSLQTFYTVLFALLDSVCCVPAPLSCACKAVQQSAGSCFSKIIE